MNRPPEVVIIGGGFAGLHCAKALRKTAVEVTLVDRRNFHLFQPLLYQVATGGLSPGDITSPLRFALRRQKNARVILAEALDFDLEAKKVILSDGSLSYDYLIVASGSRVDYFGRDDWEKEAPGLKSIEDATEIRRRILTAFEAAERESRHEAQRAWLTFVIIGGGPTGVELAGSLAELARETLPRDFRRIDTGTARIVLVEGRERLLTAFPEALSRSAAAALAQLGVEVRTSTLVEAVEERRVRLRSAAGEESLPARTILWAAGVQASPLGRALAAKTGVALDRQGRIAVEPDFTLPGHPDVFAIGDLASYAHDTGRPLPGIAPVAMQEGAHAARLIRARVQGGTCRPFRYHDQGNLATIGRSRAVAQLGRLHFSGLPAWLLWVSVHILHLIDFENRLLVLVQWAWNYFTWNRSARIITGASQPPNPPPAQPSEGPESQGGD